MINIATVFSGIGAPEQAMKQLNLDYKIVFACDNGERYVEISENDIQTAIEQNPNKTVQEVVKEAYNLTGKPNNVKKSYFANYEISENEWYEDIRFLDGTKYKGSVDIIVGGAPCQSFSTYGHKMGLEDTRGTLFYDYARIIKEVQPKAFIFENVTGLLSHDHGNTWKVIKGVFEELNYVISMQVLNAMDYNLPHLRKRVFVVAIRKDLNVPAYKFPEKVPLTHKSTDYLEHYVDDSYYLPQKGFEFVTNPLKSGRRARANQDVIGCQTANQQFNWVGDFRVEDPKPSHYANPKIYVGEYEGKPAVARKLMPVETLRLMGFEDFNIVVEDKVMWRQCGNSIAVPVMKAVLLRLIETLGLD